MPGSFLGLPWLCSLWFIAAVHGGCSPDRHNSAEPPDPLRVPLVQSPAEQWRLGSEPAVDVGGMSADGPLFHRIDAPAWLPDGSFLVADDGDGRIYRFDPNGRPLGTFGGIGFGPGEFRAIRGVVPLEDGSILVYDPGIPRFTRFSLDGSVLSTERVEIPDDWEVTTATYRLAGRVSADEVVLIPEGMAAWSQPSPRTFWASLPILRFGLEGSLSGPLGPEWGIQAWGDERTTLAVPFGRRVVAHTVGSAIAVGDTHAGTIELWEAGGSSTLLLHLEASRSPLTVEIRESWIDFRASSIEEPAVERELREWLDGVPFPDSLPFFSDVKLDSEGRIWLKEPALPGAAGTDGWVVLEPEGIPAARIEIPRELQIWEIRGDRVLGVWTDSLGVETVRIYDLVPYDTDVTRFSEALPAEPARTGG